MRRMHFLLGGDGGGYSTAAIPQSADVWQMGGKAVFGVANREKKRGKSGKKSGNGTLKNGYKQRPADRRTGRTERNTDTDICFKLLTKRSSHIFPQSFYYFSTQKLTVHWSVRPSQTHNHTWPITTTRKRSRPKKSSESAVRQAVSMKAHQAELFFFLRFTKGKNGRWLLLAEFLCDKASLLLCL